MRWWDIDEGTTNERVRAEAHSAKAGDMPVILRIAGDGFNT
jgi:hypothetical protein